MSKKENPYNLPRFKSHVLLLVDIVADASGKTELIDEEKLKDTFLRRLSTAKMPTPEEVQAAAEVTVDDVLQRALRRKEELDYEIQLTPQGKVDLYEAEHPNLRPSRKTLSRREMLRNLVSGDIHPSDLKSDEQLEQDLPGYFEQVLEAALDAELGIYPVMTPQNQRNFYFKPLLSGSYARLLAAKDDEEALICDQIRENSRIYPRPVPAQMFLENPFNIERSHLEDLIESIGQNEQYKDIKFTRTSLGTIFFYSDKYLEDDFADFLAEEQESRPLNP